MPAIRRQINIAAPPRAVWNVLTTGEGLSSWLTVSARIEGREGGRIVLTQITEGAAPARSAEAAEGAEPAEPRPAEARGIVHTWRPTSHLEIAFDRAGQSELRGSHMAFKLARDGDESRLTLVHSGGEALEDDHRRAAIDRLWAVALTQLQALLDRP